MTVRGMRVVSRKPERSPMPTRMLLSWRGGVEGRQWVELHYSRRLGSGIVGERKEASHKEADLIRHISFGGGLLMPNDARLGLVVGVTVVILVAVLFVRKDSMSRGSAGRGSPTNNAAAVVQLPPAVPGVPRPGLFQARTHTVGEGETLTSVAVQYYNDPAQVSLLFRANRDRIMAPDRVPIGTVLLIPDR